MLLQSFLSDLYFLKHCHCQSPSSRGRRQAANEQLAVNYPLPNHLHLISGAGKAGTHATSREKVGTEQRQEVRGAHMAMGHPWCGIKPRQEKQGRGPGMGQGEGPSAPLLSLHNSARS